MPRSDRFFNDLYIYIYINIYIYIHFLILLMNIVPERSEKKFKQYFSNCISCIYVFFS